MNLRDLLSGTPHTSRGRRSPDVTEIVFDSREVRPGCLFVAVPGVALDGHDFLAQAVARGASALLVEDLARVPPGFAGTVVVVPRARDAFNHCASRFFGAPGQQMFSVGVTGTDGKTSVAWMVEAVLTGAGTPTAVIGTVDHHFGDHTWPGETTPPPLVLQERLAQFLALGARAVVLEATSQGLSQSRVGSVPLDVAVFTNLTRDHLDYHGSLDAYFEAKERLFTETLAASSKPARHAVVNVDTAYGARLRVPEGVKRWTYGRIGTRADLTYEVLATGLERSRFRLRAESEEAELELPMLGAFHGANALAAVAVGLAAGRDFEGAVDALRRFRGVPGRVERVAGTQGKTVFIDYAHDPDAFEQVLGTAKAALRVERPGAELITVFGCGGDRDRGKRPLMLAAALRSSDVVFVTSDNPRSEDPRAIVDDILHGLPPGIDPERVVVELDRAAAIRLALSSARDGDVVMILGKGHEPYQIVGDRRVAYSDHAAVRAALEGS